MVQEMKLMGGDKLIDDIKNMAKDKALGKSEEKKKKKMSKEERALELKKKKEK